MQTLLSPQLCFLQTKLLIQPSVINKLLLSYHTLTPEQGHTHTHTDEAAGYSPIRGDQTMPVPLALEESLNVTPLT